MQYIIDHGNDIMGQGGRWARKGCVWVEINAVELIRGVGGKQVQLGLSMSYGSVEYSDQTLISY